MDIFKPNQPKSTPCTLNIDDEFFNYSHGMDVIAEFTLCGIACEEWNYVEKTPRKRITCPECLRVIRHCKKYKL